MTSLTVLTPVGALLFLALVSRLFEKRWTAPSVFFCALWALYLVAVLPFSLGYPYYYLSTGAVWWIVGSCFAVFLGGLVAVGARPLSRDGHQLIRSRVLVLPYVSIVMIICITAGFLYPFVLQDNRSPSIYVQLMQVLDYVGLQAGGLALTSTQRPSVRLLCLLTLTPAVFRAFVYTVRGNLLLSFGLFVGAYVTGMLVTNKKFRKNVVIVGAIGTIAFISVAILLTTLRYQVGSLAYSTSLPYYSFSDRVSDVLTTLWTDIHDFNTWLTVGDQKIAVFFGHIPAFSLWFDEHWLQTPPAYGSYTFARVLGSLGVIETPSVAPFTDYVTLSPNITTNVYTVFRELITDFTPAGSLLVLFIVGMIMRWIYQSVCAGKILLAVPLILFYDYTFCSPMMSVFRYNTIWVSALLVTVYLYWAKVVSPSEQILTCSLTPHTVTVGPSSAYSVKTRAIGE